MPLHYDDVLLVAGYNVQYVSQLLGPMRQEVDVHGPCVHYLYEEGFVGGTEALPFIEIFQGNDLFLVEAVLVIQGV